MNTPEEKPDISECVDEVLWELANPIEEDPDPASRKYRTFKLFFGMTPKDAMKRDIRRMIFRDPELTKEVLDYIERNKQAANPDPYALHNTYVKYIKAPELARG